ncbi:MAG: hypothetical protein HY319_21830 [Armatimonadetes bacterium]|nr:hypothetical protein [Armatimonadota bacterium]
MRWVRSWWCLAVLVALVTGTAGTARESGHRALVVVFSREGDARDPALRDALKQLRSSHSLDIASMPIVRMYWSVPAHRTILEEDLGLNPDRLPVAGVALRDEAGWPRRWLFERSLSGGSTGELAVELVEAFLTPEPQRPDTPPLKAPRPPETADTRPPKAPRPPETAAPRPPEAPLPPQRAAPRPPEASQPPQVLVLLVADSTAAGQRAVIEDLGRELDFLGSPVKTYDFSEPSQRQLCDALLKPEELPWAGVVEFRDGLPRRVLRASSRVNRPMTVARELLRSLRLQPGVTRPGTTGRP